MLRPKHPMALTAELVARVERMERDTSPEPGLTRLKDEDYDGIADALLRQYSPTTFWLFAYGSLIWKPEVTSLEHRHGIAYGWHRSFCLELKSWRGTPDVPGLMLALDRGGCCEGVVYRLPDNDHHDQLRRLLRRELGYREDVAATRWINVRTDAGTVRALAFYAGPRGGDYSGKRTPEEVAAILARAAGHMGSCAMYLYQTVRKLEEHGIHDRRMWRLQELVALNIAAMAQEDTSH